MPKRTSLYDAHVECGAKIVDFAGWEMPIHYGSQLKEHECVRSDAGMFDVSHMTVIDILGQDAKAFLQYLLANDIDKLTYEGKALYSGLLNQDAKVIDDLIVYRTGDHFRMVVNASTRDKDLAWIQKEASAFTVEVKERDDLSMIAIQGPQARQKAALAKAEIAELVQNLKVFQGLSHGEWFIARTGYTGEDGLEIMLPHSEASSFWFALKEAGVQPIGLGARDTLRLEAGMNLYGHEMDESISPLECNMGWTLSFSEERNFIGKAALEAELKAAEPKRLFGLILLGKGVMREGLKVSVPGKGEGIITSGTFSPSLKKSIAMARLPEGSEGIVQVDIRGQWVEAQIVALPFVRQGKILV